MTFKPIGYPTKYKHLGDYIKAHRLETGLLQRQAGLEIGVCEAVVRYWEKGYRQPAIEQYPNIFRFLGCDPRPARDGLGMTLLRWRQYRGWSRKRMAACLKVDERTLVRWETDYACETM